MRHSSAASFVFGGLLLAAPLSVAASPIDVAPSNQIVFAHDDTPSMQQGGAGEATHREPDLVDQMLAEAQSKGEDLRQWGIEIVDGQAQAMDESSRKLWQVEQQQQEDAEDVFLEVSEFTKDLVADLSDDLEKAKLMMEAAMDDAIFSILPISEQEAKSKKEGLQSLADADMMDGPPGSGWVWNVCGSGDEAIVLQDIKVNPDPPKAGENLTVHAVGEVKHDLKVRCFALPISRFII